MDKNFVIESARRTLTTIANAALATATPDGRPWNSPIYVAFDANRTIYWASQNDAVHSRNIAVNPRVMLVVFDSTTPDDTGHAVYIDANARELADEGSIEAALACLAGRKHELPKSPGEFIGPHRRRLYAAEPTRVWTNVVHEQNGHFSDERVLVDLITLGAEG